MAQLGRFDNPVLDTEGNALVGMSVALYREGATVNGNQSGTSPFTVNVRHRGKIVVGDSVFIGTATGTVYSVNSVTATTVVLSGFGGTLGVSGGDRLTPATNVPTLYSDDQAATSTANPIVTTSAGRASVWMECGAYDVVISGTGINSEAFTSQVTSTETPGQVRFADSFNYPGSTTGGLQEALDDIPAGGGIVVLSGNRTYSCSTDITVPDGGSIRGAGDSSLVSFAVSGKVIKNAPNAGNISLRDFKVDHNRDSLGASSFSAITLTTGSGLNYLIDSVHVFDAQQDGILVVGTVGQKANVKITNCKIDTTERHGIEYRDVEFGKIRGNTLLNTNNATLGGSIYCSTSGSKDCVISGNHVFDSNDNGIRVAGSNTSVVGNIIRTCVTDCIRTSNNDCAVVGNTVVIGTTANMVGIKHEDGARVSISGNNINGGASGIIVRYTASVPTDVTVNGNTVTGATDGIEISAVGRCTVTGNTVSSSGQYGIIVQPFNAAHTVDDLTIANNTIYNSGTSAANTYDSILINVSGAGTVTNVVVDGNHIDGNAGQARRGINFSNGTFLLARNNRLKGHASGSFNKTANASIHLQGNSPDDGFTQNLANVGDTILAIGDHTRLTSTGALGSLTATPLIADGFDGQFIRIINVDSADAITIPGGGATNLRLTSSPRTLGTGDSLELVFDATIGDWIEVGFTNVA